MNLLLAASAIDDDNDNDGGDNDNDDADNVDDVNVDVVMIFDRLPSGKRTKSKNNFKKQKQKQLV